MVEILTQWSCTVLGLFASKEIQENEECFLSVMQVLDLGQTTDNIYVVFLLCRISTITTHLNIYS